MQVIHAYRKYNKVANNLASEALNLPRGLHVFEALSFLVNIEAVMEDSLGATSPRKILNA